MHFRLSTPMLVRKYFKSNIRCFCSKENGEPGKLFKSAWKWKDRVCPDRRHNFQTVCRNLCNYSSRRKPNYTERQMEFFKYTRNDLKDLDRRNLQLICKSIQLNGSVKTSKMIENVMEYMDRNGLEHLSYFPFHTDFKSDQNIAIESAPLNIHLDQIKTNCCERLYESKYPSVTTVLKSTLSEKNAKQLANWKAREVEAYGEENFNKTMKECLASGSSLHKVVAKWLNDYHEFETKKAEKFRKNFSQIRTKEHRLDDRGQFFYRILYDGDEDVEESLHFKRTQSLINVFLEIDNVLAIESGVIHDPLGYAGTVDCVVEFRGKICLIDWKTSKRMKKSWKSCYDYPIQLVAYAAAINSDPAYDFAVHNVALVFVNDTGSPAQVLTMSMEECLPYYYEWQGRLERYKQYIQERNDCVDGRE